MAIILVKPVIAITGSYLEGFVGASVYCLHAYADCDWCIWIRDKTPAFLTWLHAPYLYCVCTKRLLICIKMRVVRVL